MSNDRIIETITDGFNRSSLSRFGFYGRWKQRHVAYVLYLEDVQSKTQKGHDPGRQAVRTAQVKHLRRLVVFH